jgi:hypothetical protein
VRYQLQFLFAVPEVSMLNADVDNTVLQDAPNESLVENVNTHVSNIMHCIRWIEKPKSSLTHLDANTCSVTQAS